MSVSTHIEAFTLIATIHNFYISFFLSLCCLHFPHDIHLSSHMPLKIKPFAYDKLSPVHYFIIPQNLILYFAATNSNRYCFINCCHYCQLCQRESSFPQISPFLTTENKGLKYLVVTSIYPITTVFR